MNNENQNDLGINTNIEVGNNTIPNNIGPEIVDIPQSSDVNFMEIKEEVITPEIEKEGGTFENSMREEDPNNKKGSSPILIFVVFGLLFAFIIGLPYVEAYLTEQKGKTDLSQMEKDAKALEEKQKQAIEEAIKKQEEANKANNTDDTVLSQTTCSIVGKNTGYNLEVTNTLGYNGDLIKTSTVKMKITFATITSELFKTSSKSCQEDVTAYQNQTGLTYQCNVVDNTIEATMTYDLSTYTGIMVTNFAGFNTTLKTAVKYNDSLTAKVQEFITEGATCQ